MSILQDPRPPDQETRDRQLLTVLQRVWTFAFTTKSDIAREYADEIAEGTSRGFLTTRIVLCRPEHGRLWKITPLGLAWLDRHSRLIADEEVQNYVQSYANLGPL